MTRARIRNASRRRHFVPKGFTTALGVVAIAAAAPLVAQSASGALRSGSVTTSDDVAAAAAQGSVDTRELVVNGDFEDGLNGWRINDSGTTALSLSRSARSGGGAALLKATTTGTVTLNDATNTVSSTEAGATYQASAYVKGSSSGLSALLRLRETVNGQLVDSGGSLVQLTTSWQKVTLTYTTKSTGGRLDLNVVGWKFPAGASLTIDDVSLRKVANAPVSSSTKPAPSTTTSAVVTKPTTSVPPTSQPVTSVPPTSQPVSSTTAAPQPPTSTTTASSKPTTSFTVITKSSTSTTSATVSSKPTTSTTTAVTTSKPVTSTTTAPPPSSGGGSGCFTARGIPTCGGTYLGAAIGSNTDPAAKEKQYGTNLALHRTYYSSTAISGAVKNAKADISAGRVPWISFKLPYSWTDMVNGKGDAWARDIATQLDAVNGPVWVAFHHEPEKDGNLKDWVKLQARLSPILRSADNVAFTIILTGWNQVFTNDPQYSFQAMWPGDGLVDILGIDPYNDYGVVKNGTMITKSTELKEYYGPLAAFASAHRARWAVAETGYTDVQAARDPAWLNRAFTDMRSMGGIGLSYFDTHLNAYGSWALETNEKVDAYSSALRGTTRFGR